MLSSVASRSLLRGSGKAAHGRAFASFGFPSANTNSDHLTTTQTKITHSSSNHSASIQQSQIHSLAAAHHHSLNRPVMLMRQHPATPVFVGFAPYSPSLETKEESLEEDEAMDDEAMDMDEEESSQKEGMQMSNRNNRSSKKHKANHGKRPCNRNARRAKLIKLGRRRRS